MECSQQNDCCRETNGKYGELKSELEVIKQKMKDSDSENKLYIDTLKESISFRDDLILAAKSELEEKNSEISELRVRVEESNKKVSELTETVGQLVRELKLLKNPSETNEKSTQPGEETSADRAGRNKQKPKKKQKQITMEDIFGSTPQPFTRFFILNYCEKGIKRTICPFKFEKDLISLIGGKPRRINGNGKNGYLIEVDDLNQSEKIKNIEEVGGNACSIKVHEFFNGSKGIIYIHGNDITDLASFRNGLSQEYGVSDVEEAKWIKTRKEHTKAFIVTFGDGNLPDSLHIAGEHTLTKVYPYRNKPLQCNKCQMYGHTSKRCSDAEPKCRRCAENHPVDQCQADYSKCANCGENHVAGHKSCKHNIEEHKILEIQSKMKVGRGAAREILSGKPPTTHEAKIEADMKYLMVTVDRELLRSICPFKIEKFWTSQFELKRENITTVKKGFIIKTSPGQQITKLLKLNKILNVKCTVTTHHSYNSSKGIVYIRDYDIKNIPSFEEGLKMNCNVSEVTQAHWIKPKNDDCKAFSVSFNQTRTPNSIYIPGEQSRTKVYEHFPRPLFCKNCLEYNHTKNHCPNQIKCQNCTEEHLTENCTQQAAKCLHCGAPHRSGDKNCPKQKQESSICSIQYKEKISWPSARQKYFSAMNENTYAYKLKNTLPSNPAPKNQPSLPLNNLPKPPQNRGTSSRRHRESDSSDNDQPHTANKKGRPDHADQVFTQRTLETEDVAMSSEEETSENSERIRAEAQKVYDMLTLESTNLQDITTPGCNNNNNNPSQN